MATVTGVGGIFFKSNGDGAALAAWYQKHLGMPLVANPHRKKTRNLRRGFELKDADGYVLFSGRPRS